MLQLTMYLQGLLSKVQREEGQTAIEYALVLLLVAIVLAVALGTGLTGALSQAITDIKNAL
jgi:Flp pilus assembly pilin Flp